MNTPSAAPTPASRAERLVANAEQARRRFHELHAALSADDRRRRSIVGRWTVQAILLHMASVLGQGVPLMLENARRGRPLPRLLRSGFGNLLVYHLTQSAARRKTPAQIATAYDQAHAALLAAGAALDHADWARTTTMGYGNTITVEQLMVQLPLWHVRLHATEICMTLARPLPEADRTYHSIEAEPLHWADR